MTTDSNMGLRNWQKFFFQLGLVLPLLVGMQVLLVVLLMVVEFLPSHLPDVSLVQLGSVWLGSASVATLIVLAGFRRRTRVAVPRASGVSLVKAIPQQVTHDCVLLRRGHHFLAVGFLTLASRWLAKENRSVFEALYRAGTPVTWVIARTVDQQNHVCLAIPSFSDTAEAAAEGAIRASQGLHQRLSERGVQAQWVRDELGVEQLYWLCVLGKAFHEDVELRCEGRLVAARVGVNPSRLLAALDLRPDKLEEPLLDRRATGLLHLIDSDRPFFLTLTLKPITSEEIAQRLRHLAAHAPDVALLAEALTETEALRVYAQSQVPALAEAVSLLAGRKEGLWKTGVRLVCTVADAPLLTEGFALSPRLLGCTGFAETAALQVSCLDQPVTTTSLLDLLGQPGRRRSGSGDHPEMVQSEAGSEGV